jgi:FAD/FMN-containing dehydrogenase
MALRPERPIDRRTFLAGAGAAGLALAACGSESAARTIVRAAPPVARRRAGSVAGGLARAIRGPVIARGKKGFVTAAHVYNERFNSVLPLAVARPLDATDVRNAVRYLVTNGTRLRVRSGGHSYAGYSTISNGVELDMRNLRNIVLDRRAGTATIGVGAALIDVYAKLNSAGVTIPAGSCPSVGVGGHALGGGMGLVGRAFGLASDNILAAQIVTADGKVRNVSPASDPDLLWGLRGGGGGNFGVVTHFKFRVHGIPSSPQWFFVNWPWSSASEALAAWLAWAPHTTSQITSIFHLETGAGSPVVSVAGQYLGGAGGLSGLLGPLAAVPGASISTGSQSYFSLMLRWAGCLGRSVQSCHTVGTRPGGMLERASFNAKSDYLTGQLSAAARGILVGAIERRQGQPGSGAILFDSYGGAINRISPTATAFVHRNDIACIQYLAYNGGGSWLNSTYASMRRHVSGMAYQNYIDSTLKNWRKAYYGSNYGRLVKLQKTVDPDHYFNFPQAIGH